MVSEESAKNFHKAMKGLGTDESKIIKEICGHSKEQLQEIKKAYLTMFGKNLEDDIKSEISGHFLTGVLGLLKTTNDYEAECIRKAMKGLGTDEDVLIEILCSKEGHEIRTLAQTYKMLFQRDLAEDVASEQGGDLGRIFKSISSGNRPDSCLDYNLAVKEANELYKAGEGRLGTDECEFIRILCSRSFPQLRETFKAYLDLHKSDIENAIMKETSGNFEKALLAIVKSARNRSAYFAESMHQAMKGLGTKDEKLIRLLVSRSENLKQIKIEYKRLYGKSLYDAVKSELSGDYEKLFLTLIGKD